MQSKNKKFLIVYAVIIGAAITNFAIVSFSGASPQIKYIPINNFFLEWMYNMLLLPLIVAFIGFCMGYVLSPLM